MKNKSPLLIILTVIIAVLFAVSLGLSLSTCKKQQASAYTISTVRSPTFTYADSPWVLTLNSFSDNPDPALGGFSIVSLSFIETVSYAFDGLDDDRFYRVHYLSPDYIYISVMNMSERFRIVDHPYYGESFAPPNNAPLTPYFWEAWVTTFSASSYNGDSLLPGSTLGVLYRWFFSETRSTNDFYIEVFVPDSDIEEVGGYSLLSLYDFPGSYSDGFNNGYDAGLVDGGKVASESLQVSYDRGYEAGRIAGASTSLDQISPYYLLGGFMNQFLNINIFPGVSIGWLFTVQFGFILLGLVLKIFLGG